MNLIIKETFEKRRIEARNKRILSGHNSEPVFDHRKTKKPNLMSRLTGRTV